MCCPIVPHSAAEVINLKDYHFSLCPGKPKSYSQNSPIGLIPARKICYAFHGSAGWHGAVFRAAMRAGRIPAGGVNPSRDDRQAADSTGARRNFSGIDRHHQPWTPR